MFNDWEAGLDLFNICLFVPLIYALQNG